MRDTLLQLKQDWAISTTVAGFLAVLISYAGPLIIFFQVAQHANIPNETLISWIWSISIAAAVASIFLSLRYKVPIVMAWSAPGSALLISLLPNMSLNEIVAGYMITALALFVIGITGYFDKLIAYIPNSIAAGMMAGILVQFGFGVFQATTYMPWIVLAMVLAFLIAKRFNPRYAMIWVLATGILASFIFGKFNAVSIQLELAIPQWTSPEWTWSALFNVAIPLLLVSLSGQFLPGMSLLKLNGYKEMTAKPILTTASITSFAVAGFGGITTVLGSITAALCTGHDAHENPAKRYIAGICNGLFYILGGLFAGSLVLLFSLFPKELIAALAGLALLGAISSNLSIALKDDADRDAALITFLATASGMSVLGLSSVFWGICIGMLSYYILKPRTVTK